MKEFTVDDIRPSRVVLRPPPRPPRLTADEFIAAGKARKEAYEKAVAAGGAAMVALLNAGMREWMAKAKQKWNEHGGYGMATDEQMEEMRAAGYEPRPRVHWSEVSLPASASSVRATPSSASCRAPSASLAAPASGSPPQSETSAPSSEAGSHANPDLAAGETAARSEPTAPPAEATAEVAPTPDPAPTLAPPALSSAPVASPPTATSDRAAGASKTPAPSVATLVLTASEPAPARRPRRPAAPAAPGTTTSARQKPPSSAKATARALPPRRAQPLGKAPAKRPR